MTRWRSLHDPPGGKMQHHSFTCYFGSGWDQLLADFFGWSDGKPSKWQHIASHPRPASHCHATCTHICTFWTVQALHTCQQCLPQHWSYTHNTRPQPSTLHTSLKYWAPLQQLDKPQQPDGAAAVLAATQTDGNLATDGKCMELNEHWLVICTLMCMAGTEGMKCRHELAHWQGGDGEALDGNTELVHISGKQSKLEASSCGDTSGGGGGYDHDHIFSIFKPMCDLSYNLFFFFTPWALAQLEMEGFMRKVWPFLISCGADVQMNMAKWLVTLTLLHTLSLLALQLHGAHNIYLLHCLAGL